MELDEYIKQEELHRLEIAFRRLTPFQKKSLRYRIAIQTFPRRLYKMLQRHIAARRAGFAYYYPAHWLKG